MVCGSYLGCSFLALLSPLIYLCTAVRKAARG